MTATVTVTIALGDGADAVHAGPMSAGSIPSVPEVPDFSTGGSASDGRLADIPPPPGADGAGVASKFEAVPPPPDVDGSDAEPEIKYGIAPPPDAQEAGALDTGIVPPLPGESEEEWEFEPASEDFLPPPEG